MVLGVVGITILSRKNKSTLMIIPCLLLCFIAYKVQAYPEAEASHSDEVFCFPITVEDGKGDALPGVQIDVYATPVIDAQSAVKFDANGGNFFDGSTEMYFRIPYNGCTFNEFINSLDSTTNHYLNENIDKAYRSGYSRGFPIAPDNLTNGMVLPVIWSENVNDFLLRLDGNGGVYDYYGESLKSLVFANDSDYYSYVNNFVNTGSYFIGLDDTPTCSRYSSNGLDVQHYRRIQYRQAGEYDQVVYMCWNKKPDGIYVNGTLLRGNTDSCFEESSLEIAGSSYYFWSYDLNLEIFEENNKLYFRIFDSISKRIDEARLNNSYTIILIYLLNHCL